MVLNRPSLTLGRIAHIEEDELRSAPRYRPNVYHVPGHAFKAEVTALRTDNPSERDYHDCTVLQFYFPQSPLLSGAFHPAILIRFSLVELRYTHSTEEMYTLKKL